MKSVLIFLCGYITHALIFDKKFRGGVFYIITFRWLHIGFPDRDETRGKFTYHKDPKKTPKGYKRVWPPRHAGGAKKGKLRAYPEQDKKAVEMVLDKNMSPRQVFDELRPEYFPDDIWNSFDNIAKGQEYDAFRKRIENAINALDDN